MQSTHSVNSISLRDLRDTLVPCTHQNIPADTHYYYQSFYLASTGPWSDFLLQALTQVNRMSKFRRVLAIGGKH